MASKPSKAKSIKSLHFLAGKEADSWKSFEKRFNGHAIDGKLYKDKFGDCIGKKIMLFFFFFFVSFREFLCVCLCL